MILTRLWLLLILAVCHNGGGAQPARGAAGARQRGRRLAGVGKAWIVHAGREPGSAGFILTGALQGASRGCPCSILHMRSCSWGRSGWRRAPGGRRARARRGAGCLPGRERAGRVHDQRGAPRRSGAYGRPRTMRVIRSGACRTPGPPLPARVRILAGGGQRRTPQLRGLNQRDWAALSGGGKTGARQQEHAVGRREGGRPRAVAGRGVMSARSGGAQNARPRPSPLPTQLRHCPCCCVFAMLLCFTEVVGRRARQQRRRPKS